jgi:hypothetical protein
VTLSKAQITWLALLLPLALASAAVGTDFALTHSQDLQWDEARLILDGINPYLLYFDPALPRPDYVVPERLGLTQPPSAVLLFAPIALPSFEHAKILWILINFAATPAFVLLSARLFCPGRFGWFGLFAITLLFIVSMPWRITLGNGQYCLVAMTLFLVALHFFRERRLGLATLFAALALMKHILVLPFFALFLPRKRDMAFVLAGALLIHAGLTVVAGLMVGERPDLLLLQSLRIASSIAGAGAYDLFAFQAFVAPRLGTAAPMLAASLLIALTVAMCWRGAGLRELAALSIVSIVIVYHRSYDAIVLMFLVLHLLARGMDERGASAPLDRAELHLGWAIIAYIFAVDQFVYGLLGPETHARINAGFSALLYAYLGLLIFRSFRERTRPRSARRPAPSPSRAG